MSKPSSSRFIVRYLHHISSKPSTIGNPTTSGISNLITSNPKIIQNPKFSQRPHFSSSPPNNISGLFGKLDPHAKLLPNKHLMGFRYFSFKNYAMGSKNFAKKVVENPALAVKTTFARYKEAVGLQIEAFWKRNYMVVLGAGGFVVCILLWRVLFGIANTFIGFSEGMAKYGFLALSSAIVAFTGLYFRSKFTINPDKVYRMAMRRLNTSAGILEVMGAPLTGTDLRAYVMSGGGITLKNFKPKLRSKRCFLIFPIRGSERKGLVSVEVKKSKGQYDMKLLAVDIPMASGPDQRLFLIGDEEEYRVGGGLISELRDPVVTALAAAKEFEARDEKEDEEDAAREREEAERKNKEEIEKLEKGESQ
ncbi:hypothetical protein BUALT_Bualt01G0057800 [Buddleja alternifolia]|uniref:Import inner membrane translocase subunit n=1 Tax=Buddleja alternifolia TaxID=168488 RepID=A0AAV6YFA3_9LAMI|nr:hypothetical protein BUALT_Bualt01G0057800 [Buddleja alternifolia]